jgi:FAD/FMN-containing dehydrogenase
MYPLDIGARGSSTIGGNIATNAGGNRVLRYGMTRDMVLGLEAVLADGTVVSSMNEMIKNNAGYDLKQLFIGTEGSLGVVTRAVLRLREQPRSQETLLVAVDRFEQLPELLKVMDGKLGGTLSAFEVMWNEFYCLVTTEPAQQKPPLDQTYPYYVLIEAMGGDSETDRARLESALAEVFEAGLVRDAVLAENEAQRRELWAMRDDVEQVNRFDPVFIYDVSMRISKMQEYVDEVNRRLAASFGDYQNFTFGHIGDGNIHFAISAGTDSEAHHEVNCCVYEPLRSIRGSVSAEHGVGLEKKRYLDISRTDEEVRLMRSLKTALDPKGILNPGKIFDVRAA